MEIYTFLISLKHYDDLIWRKVKLRSNMTVAMLAYTILASFDTRANHLYDIKHDRDVYDCYVYPDGYMEKPKNATITKLNELLLSPGEKLTMNYDYGSDWAFNITFIESEKYDRLRHANRPLPIVIEGEGKGIIEDIHVSELEGIIEDIRSNGVARYKYLNWDDKKVTWNYTSYKVSKDNEQLIKRIKFIKKGYERNRE